MNFRRIVFAIINLLGDKHPDRRSKKISEGLTAVKLQDSEMEEISGSDDDFGPSDDGYFV